MKMRNFCQGEKKKEKLAERQKQKPKKEKLLSIFHPMMTAVGFLGGMSEEN